MTKRFGVDKAMRWGSEDEALHLERIAARAWWQVAIDWILRAEYIHGGTFVVHFKRWCIGGWFGGRRVYVHRFEGSDYARDLHDHPKTFISIGLRGGYIEETTRKGTEGQPLLRLPRVRNRFVAPWFRRFPPKHTHRIRVAPGTVCWTLCLTGRIQRGWGFWSRQSRTNWCWIWWRDYIYGGLR
ncbi:MAG: hypothetical protein OXC11_00710 [Rhodospirillales bacterium]|nr:hypothetical protein [Rhodospirillales bacterium]